MSPSNVTQPGALSPGALSQTSQNAGNTNASVSNGNGATSASTCCENGRPIMTDPVSGQTVCSCQYDSARLALSGYSRLPSSSVYGTPYPSTDQNPYPSIGVDSSAFYSPLVSTTKKITQSYTTNKTKQKHYKQHFYTVFVLDFFHFYQEWFEGRLRFIFYYNNQHQQHLQQAHLLKNSAGHEGINEYLKQKNNININEYKKNCFLKSSKTWMKKKLYKKSIIYMRVLKRLQHCVVWCHLNSKIYKYMYKKKAKTNIYVALVRY